MAEIDLSGTVKDVNDLAASVVNLASVMESEFGKITKRVNLFGTNVAKRMERIRDSMQGMSDTLQSAGGGITGIGGGIASSISQIGGSIGGIGSGLDSVAGGITGIGDGIGSVGSGFVSAAGGINAMASALPAAGKGMADFAVSISGITGYIPQIAVFMGVMGGFALLGGGLEKAGAGILGVGGGLLSMARSMVLAAEGLMQLAIALPLAGQGFMSMLTAVEPILAYIPQLAVFVLTLGLFSLMGEGLIAAGNGMLALAAGFLQMGAALPVVTEGMLGLIQNLMDVQINIGGIITFCVLALAMFIMAEAIKSINENLAPMVESMASLQKIFSVGLVVGIGVFAVMMVLLALTLDKVAKGMDKVTQAMKKQCSQLAVLIPMQATSAILANPIVGAVTVALAAAAGVVMGALMPKMATGGVATGTTVAMIGEGRYPEAVIPLGRSPQFQSMKADIAKAVVDALAAVGGKPDTASVPCEIVLNVDGDKLARIIVPAINRESRRTVFSAAVKEY